MPLESLSRPAEVDCLSFENVGAGKCRHYSKGGVCALAEIAICTEWAKRNVEQANAQRAARSSGSRPPIPSITTVHDPGPGAQPERRQLALLPGLPPEPAEAPLPARSAHAARTATHAATGQPSALGARMAALAGKPLTADLISTKDADDLAARGYELCVEGWDPAQDVWIVPNLTGADRIELTYTQAVTLANMIAAFPGSKVKVITNASAPGSTASPNTPRATGT